MGDFYFDRANFNFLMELNKTYYLTATILRWNTLLQDDRFKLIIIESLKFLAVKGKIKLFGFVIMPNHIHLIWEMVELNGKESPYASFMKHTAHKFLSALRKADKNTLKNFKVSDHSRTYNFWQRNPLAIHLYSPEFIHQKLEYIHNNPVQGNWMLANSPVDYKFSSASYYETGIDRFGILTHIGEKL